MNLSICLAGGLLVSVLSLGWAADHYHDKAVEWRTAAHQSKKIVRQQAATITDINQRQQQLATLDKTHTEALSAAESQNDALRRQLADGTRRVYVRANCPVSGAGKTTATGSLGDGTAVDLTGNAGSNILDIRAGIIRDREKLKYLQDYIRQQCLN